MPRRPAPPALVTLAARAAACRAARSRCPIGRRPCAARGPRPCDGAGAARACGGTRGGGRDARPPLAGAGARPRGRRLPLRRRRPLPRRPAARRRPRRPARRAPSGAPARASSTAAGRVPGRGLGVTVRCGELAATHLGLAGVRVRRGRLVVAGARLGTALGPVVRLGARRAGRRHGYVDPAGLLGGLGPGTAATGARPAAWPAAAGAAAPHAAHPVRRRHALATTRTPRRAAAAPRWPGSGPRCSPSRSPWAASCGEGAAPAAGAGRRAGDRRAGARRWPRTRPLAFTRGCPPSTSRRRSTTSTRPRTSGTRTRRSWPTCWPATTASGARTCSS